MTIELHKCSNIVKKKWKNKKESAKQLNDDNTNKEWQREKKPYRKWFAFKTLE